MLRRETAATGAQPGRVEVRRAHPGGSRQHLVDQARQRARDPLGRSRQRQPGDEPLAAVEDRRGDRARPLVELAAGDDVAGARGSARAPPPAPGRRRRPSSRARSAGSR